jgi:pimeloyl-ACP methyl ester carboxylesterase
VVLNAKQPLVFLPGLLSDGSIWTYQCRALADIAECSSIEWSTENSLQGMAQTALREAPERFSVAGHSMGGRVALEIYQLAPHRVERMVLLNTGYQPLAFGPAGEQEKRDRCALLEIARSQGMPAMARKWLVAMIDPARKEDSSLTDAIAEMFGRKTPETFAAQIQALLGRPDRSELLGQIRCPTLLITGREDAWSPPMRHAVMAAKIPQSKLVVIPNCGHMSPLERPAELAEALRSWLSQPTDAI